KHHTCPRILNSRQRNNPATRRIDSKRKLPWEGGNGLREPYIASKRVLPSYAPENESNYPTGSAGFEAYALRPGRQGTQNQNHQRTGRTFRLPPQGRHSCAATAARDRRAVYLGPAPGVRSG